MHVDLAVTRSSSEAVAHTLVHPELLDNQFITLNSAQATAERAMQLVADIDGKKAMPEGNEGRFASQQAARLAILPPIADGSIT